MGMLSPALITVLETLSLAEVLTGVLGGLKIPVAETLTFSDDSVYVPGGVTFTVSEVLNFAEFLSAIPAGYNVDISVAETLNFIESVNFQDFIHLMKFLLNKNAAFNLDEFKAFLLKKKKTFTLH
jgi:hypothetical protein